MRAGRPTNEGEDRQDEWESTEQVSLLAAAKRWNVDLNVVGGACYEGKLHWVWTERGFALQKDGAWARWKPPHGALRRSTKTEKP